MMVYMIQKIYSKTHTLPLEVILIMTLQLSKLIKQFNILKIEYLITGSFI